MRQPTANCLGSEQAHEALNRDCGHWVHPMEFLAQGRAQAIPTQELRIRIVAGAPNKTLTRQHSPVVRFVGPWAFRIHRNARG